MHRGATSYPEPGCRWVRNALSRAIGAPSVTAGLPAGRAGAEVWPGRTTGPAEPDDRGVAATVMARATSAPSSSRPPGRPSRPAVLSRPASWPGCDPYRPRRRDQAGMLPAPGPLVALLHRTAARIGAALIRLATAPGGVAVLPPTATCGRYR